MASHGAVARAGNGQFGIVAKGMLAALLLVALKWFVHDRGWEFITTLPLLTALMGGVVFTLAIILAGVLADFKESERIVGELATALRRLDADFAYVAAGDKLAAMRADLGRLTRVVRENLARGEAVHMREVYAPIRALDALVVQAARDGAPSSNVRTLQVHLGNVVRIMDRIEVIIETTFMRAGYYFAALTVTAAIGALTVTRLEPFVQGLALYGFASFLLVGLTQLVWDLDNPFAGSVRLSIRQLEKAERDLAAAGPGQR